MLRIVCLALSSSVAFPAPPPVETSTSKLHRLWGEPVDPEKGCRFELEDQRLKITIPGKSRTLTTAIKTSNAPRTIKTIEGNFVLEVTLLRSDPGEIPRDIAAAGLYIWDGEDHFATAQRFHTWISNPVRRVVVYRSDVFKYDPNHHLQGHSPKHSPHLTAEEAEKPVGLRLLRTGSVLSFETRTDGKTWTRIHTHDEEFPAKVKVGVFAEQTSEKQYEAVFEGLTVSVPKK